MSPPALIHRAATAGTAHNVLGMTHVYKAGPEETGGAFLLFELLVPPGCAAPLHRHENDTECFFVLDGALTFMSPGGARIAGVGETCLLPAGGAHAFRNDGERPARALVVASPGRDAERFFAAVDAAGRSGNPGPVEVAAMAARHGLTLLPMAAE